jgi:GNAT superfamily N-acetyltransferase
VRESAGYRLGGSKLVAGDVRDDVGPQDTLGLMDMSRTPDLHANWTAWLEGIAGHVPGAEVRQFGSLRVVATGIPVPLFNQAFAFEVPADVALREAVEWLSSWGAPFMVPTPADNVVELTQIATAVGLVESDWSMPGMLMPLGDVRQPLPNGLRVVRATEPAHLDDMAVAVSGGFGPPPEIARMVTPDSVLSGDDHNQHLVGYIDDEPVASAELVATGEIAGVYTVAVPEQHRRRGYGEALTAAVLAAGRDLGCTTGCLQASAMGQPVYERMGFETFTDYRIFEPAP